MQKYLHFIVLSIFSVVTIDLKEDSFVPGKKNYERTLECLRDRLGMVFDVVLTWDPPGNDHSPTTFTTDISLVLRCRREHLSIVSGVLVPQKRLQRVSLPTRNILQGPA